MKKITIKNYVVALLIIILTFIVDFPANIDWSYILCFLTSFYFKKYRFDKYCIYL